MPQKHHGGYMAAGLSCRHLWLPSLLIRHEFLRISKLLAHFRAGNWTSCSFSARLPIRSSRIFQQGHFLATDDISTGSPNPCGGWERLLIRSNAPWALTSLTLVNLSYGGGGWEHIIAFSKSPFEGNVSSMRVNRLMWEAVILGCL